MSVNLSIKDVPEDVAQRLRERAARNHRSLQGELMAVITQAAGFENGFSGISGSSASGAPEDSQALPQSEKTSWTQGWKTIEQLIAERQARGWKPDPRMAKLPRGVDIIRADRDSR